MNAGDKVVKAQTLPVSMMKLADDLIDYHIPAKIVQSEDQGAATYDPKHYEAAEGVQRPEARGPQNRWRRRLNCNDR